MARMGRLAPDVALERLSTLGVLREPSAYELDGCTPRLAVAVTTPEQVSELIALCAAADLVVIPWGAGGQMGLGNLPEGYDVALDLRGLDLIVYYEPDDLTIGIQAGCDLGSLSATLAQHGQMLPVEATDPARVTIGGLVATGLGSPRRFGHGSLRDLIIGITVALPDGTLARGGGIVVKNVSGYDMMRLHFGALGSLGVIVQANFKVLPAPKAQRTILIDFETADQAGDAALRIRGSQLAPTALVVLGPLTAKRLVDHPAWTLAMRCEGPGGAVTRQAERLRELAKAQAHDAVMLDDEGTRVFWQRLQGELDAAPRREGMRVRLGEIPSRLGQLGSELSRELGSALEGLVLDFGSGLATTTVTGEMGNLLHSWGMLRERGIHVTLLSAPPEVKAGIDVFGRQPEGMTVIRQLKETFDPTRALNRGRFLAHL